MHCLSRAVGRLLSSSIFVATVINGECAVTNLWEIRYEGPQLSNDDHRFEAQFDGHEHLIVSTISAGKYSIIKYAAGTGQMIWERKVDSRPEKLLVDSAGNVVISSGTSTVINSVTFTESIIARVDGASGRTLWETKRGPEEEFSGYTAAVHNNGDVFVATSASGGTFVARWKAADGEPVWERILRFRGSGEIQNDNSPGGDSVQEPKELIVLMPGAGEEFNVAHSAWPEDLLGQLNAVTGEWYWFQTMAYAAEVPYVAKTATITMDHQGNMVVGGDRDGELWIAKYDRTKRNGRKELFVWYRTTPLNAPMPMTGTVPKSGAVFNGLTVDREGNVFAAAVEQSTVTGAPIGLHLLKYSSAEGTVLWKKRLGTNRWDELAGMAADVEGNVVTAVRSRRAATDDSDLYLAKFAREGTTIWESTREGLKVDSMVMNEEGQIAVVGSDDQSPVTLVFQDQVAPSVSSVSASDGSIVIKWPKVHRGLQLQIQEGREGIIKGRSWLNVPGAHLTNQITLQPGKDSRAAFFRLAKP
jgi:outer membrane protein assembly factor BamB